MTDHTATLPLPMQFSFAARPTLQKELARHGIRSIDMHRIDAHRRFTNRYLRPTWKHQLLALGGDLLWLCSLDWITKLVLPRMNIHARRVLTLLSAISLGLFGFIAGWMAFFGVLPFQVGLALFVPFLAWCLITGLVLTSTNAESNVFSRWRWHHPDSFPDLPWEVEARMDAVANIVPDVKFRILALDTDPVLIAERRGWLKTEQAVLEVWHSGDPELDTIRTPLSGAFDRAFV